MNNCIEDVAMILYKMDRCLYKNNVRWNVSSDAPQTYEDLQSSYRNTGKIVVWDGASDNTIWGKEGNYLFRAFHDYIHAHHCLRFTDEDETRVRQITCAILDLNERQSRIMEIEIDGQLQYKNKHGMFPEDQLEFFIKALSHNIRHLGGTKTCQYQ